MTNLILLTYGRENEYKRTILTVLSHYTWAKEGTGVGRVIIFTDNPEYLIPYLTGLTVEYVLLTPEKMRDLKGPDNFIHRLKVAVIEEAFKLYPSDNLLFVDSDTFFTADSQALLDSISPKASVLHLREYALETRRHEILGKKLLEFLEREPITTSKGKEQFGSSLYSWNTGAIGLDASAAAYMPDAFLLTDKLFAASNWHISEQLAFSLILQTRTKVLAADSVIYHYWQGSKKAAIDALLLPILTAQFSVLSLTEKLSAIRIFTHKLPIKIEQYLQAHPAIKLNELKAQAMYSFQIKDFAAGYNLGLSYLRRKPLDKNFIKDILYYTKKRYIK